MCTCGITYQIKYFQHNPLKFAADSSAYLYTKQSIIMTLYSDHNSSFRPYLTGVFVDLHPLMVISCEALSIILLVGSSALGRVGGKRILSPNKCFFFFTSFPDMNLKDRGMNVTTKRIHQKDILLNLKHQMFQGITYMSLLLFRASKTFSYRTDLGVLASCKNTFRETV